MISEEDPPDSIFNPFLGKSPFVTFMSTLASRYNSSLVHKRLVILI